MAERGEILCRCGRTFAHQNGFSTHQKSCVNSKKRTLSVVDKARDYLHTKKQCLAAAEEASKLSGVAARGIQEEPVLTPSQATTTASAGQSTALEVSYHLCFLRFGWLKVSQDNSTSVVPNDHSILDVQVCLGFLLWYQIADTFALVDGDRSRTSTTSSL